MELDPRYTVARLGGHEFIEELAKRIEAVAEACRAVGAGSKGKVTVSFDVGIDPKMPRNLVYVRESFKSTMPDSYVTKGQFFYIGEDGGLFDRDPQSPELPMVRALEEQQAEVRTADDAAAVRRAE